MLENELIGFKYIETQQEFEKWQLENPQFSICNVIPHLISAQVTNTDNIHASAKTVWGSFVTYRYQRQ